MDSGRWDRGQAVVNPGFARPTRSRKAASVMGAIQQFRRHAPREPPVAHKVTSRLAWPPIRPPPSRCHETALSGSARPAIARHRMKAVQYGWCTWTCWNRSTQEIKKSRVRSSVRDRVPPSAPVCRPRCYMIVLTSVSLRSHACGRALTPFAKAFSVSGQSEGHDDAWCSGVHKRAGGLRWGWRAKRIASKSAGSFHVTRLTRASASAWTTSRSIVLSSMGATV